MDLEKAIACVQAQGNTVERARLAAILWDEPPAEAALQELAAACSTCPAIEENLASPEP